MNKIWKILCLVGVLLVVVGVFAGVVSAGTVTITKSNTEDIIFYETATVASEEKQDVTFEDDDWDTIIAVDDWIWYGLGRVGVTELEAVFTVQPSPDSTFEQDQDDEYEVRVAAIYHLIQDRHNHHRRYKHS